MSSSTLTLTKPFEAHPAAASDDQTNADRHPAPALDRVADEAWAFLAGQLAWEVRLDQFRRGIAGEIAPDHRVRIQTPEAA